VDENINTIKNINALIDTGEEACLEVNAEKTKFMINLTTRMQKKIII
jgi:hypothetical protein